MANTGYDYEASISVIDAAITLTRGGTITDLSDALELDVDSGCIIYIDADYSNHAKATAGLIVSILRLVNAAGDTETVNGASISFEMPFTQAGTERKGIALSGLYYHKFKIQLDWGNTTGSSAVTVATTIEKSDIPPASA